MMKNAFYFVLKALFAYKIFEFSQPARDVPRTSSESPLKFLTSGTSRGPSETVRGPIEKLII